MCTRAPREAPPGPRNPLLTGFAQGAAEESRSPSARPLSAFRSDKSGGGSMPPLACPRGRSASAAPGEGQDPRPRTPQGLRRAAVTLAMLQSPDARIPPEGAAAFGHGTKAPPPSLARPGDAQPGSPDGQVVPVCSPDEQGEDPFLFATSGRGQAAVAEQEPEQHCGTEQEAEAQQKEAQREEAAKQAIAEGEEELREKKDDPSKHPAAELLDEMQEKRRQHERERRVAARQADEEQRRQVEEVHKAEEANQQERAASIKKADEMAADEQKRRIEHEKGEELAAEAERKAAQARADAMVAEEQQERVRAAEELEQQAKRERAESITKVKAEVAAEQAAHVALETAGKHPEGETKLAELMKSPEARQELSDAVGKQECARLRGESQKEESRQLQQEHDEEEEAAKEQLERRRSTKKLMDAEAERLPQEPGVDRNIEQREGAQPLTEAQPAQDAEQALRIEAQRKEQEEAERERERLAAEAAKAVAAEQQALCAAPMTGDPQEADTGAGGSFECDLAAPAAAAPAAGGTGSDFGDSACRQAALEGAVAARDGLHGAGGGQQAAVIAIVTRTPTPSPVPARVGASVAGSGLCPPRSAPSGGASPTPSPAPGSSVASPTPGGDGQRMSPEPRQQQQQQQQPCGCSGGEQESEQRAPPDENGPAGEAVPAAVAQPGPSGEEPKASPKKNPAKAGDSSEIAEGKKAAKDLAAWYKRQAHATKRQVAAAEKQAAASRTHSPPSGPCGNRARDRAEQRQKGKLAFLRDCKAELQDGLWGAKEHVARIDRVERAHALDAKGATAAARRALSPPATTRGRATTPAARRKSPGGKKKPAPPASGPLIVHRKNTNGHAPPAPLAKELTKTHPAPQRKGGKGSPGGKGGKGGKGSPGGKGGKGGKSAAA